MPEPTLVATHYTRGGLIDAIIAGLAKLDLTQDTVQVDDLAPVDEFHIGGRVATEAFLDQLGPAPSDHILDVGCGPFGAHLPRVLIHREDIRKLIRERL